MMQTNPKEAMQVYGKNPEFMQLFQEFCKLMGTHFSTIAEQDKNAIKNETPPPLTVQKDPEVDVNQLMSHQPKN